MIAFVRLLALAALCALAVPRSAEAQTIVWPCFGTSLNDCNNNGRVSTGNPLPVNVISGGFSGNVSNASSGVATTSTNIPTVSYNYGFNGTTWDQLQVDANKNLKVVGVGLADGATNSGTTGSKVDCLTTTTITGGSNGTVNPINCTPAGAVRYDLSTVAGVAVGDACAYQAKTNLPISFQTTSITQLIALSGSTKIYVCSLSLIASAATVFSITGGTGSNCGTPAALIGTTSASHGLSLAANGGLTLGNGSGTVAVTGAGSELCIVQSGAGDLSGNLTYVQQ